MKNLVWIASYPKSGNTWLRSIICAALTGRVILNELAPLTPGFNALSISAPNKKIPNTLANHAKNWEKAQKIASVRTKDNAQLFKTHNAAIPINGCDFPSTVFTSRAIYIIRDPRDVAVSYARHYQKDINDTVHAMLDEYNTTHDEKQIEFLSSWRMHVLSWQKKKFPVLFLRYEDLLKNTELEIQKLLKFLGIVPKISIAEVARLTSFDKLKSQEKSLKFKEAVNNQPFFWQGKSGNGKYFLGANFKKIEIEFADIIKHYGYD